MCADRKAHLSALSPGFVNQFIAKLINQSVDLRVDASGNIILEYKRQLKVYTKLKEGAVDFQGEYTFTYLLPLLYDSL